MTDPTPKLPAEFESIFRVKSKDIRNGSVRWNDDDLRKDVFNWYKEQMAKSNEWWNQKLAQKDLERAEAVKSEREKAFDEGYKASQRYYYKKQNDKQLKVRQSYRAKGLCYGCGQPAEPCRPYFLVEEDGTEVEIKTKAYCKKHLEIQKKYQAAFRKKVKNGLVIDHPIKTPSWVKKVEKKVLLKRLESLKEKKAV